METYDLRSDTVTRPTEEMRQAMANAEVGDDVFMEDPTVNRLQEMAAERMGKEAGLFVASGTMGNLIAVLTHCGRGDEAIVGNLGHTFLFEAGGISALGGVHPYVLPNQPDGTLNLDDVRNAVRADDIHAPVSKLVIIENTHNRCGGVPLTVAYTRHLSDLAHEKGIKVHLDGARIFNAAAVLGVDVIELTAPVDSITFCLSKGLCAPVGSVLCGSKEFINRARRIRKQLGGGMRQAGILAAAGIIALDKMTLRIAEDHHRAKKLASGLAAIPGIQLDPGSPYTNMIFAGLSEHVQISAADIAKSLSQKGILVGPIGPKRFRIVVHYWIDDIAVETIISAFTDVLSAYK